MTRLLAIWERYYARVTRARNRKHHRPTSAAVSTRKRDPR